MTEYEKWGIHLNFHPHWIWMSPIFYIFLFHLLSFIRLVWENGSSGVNHMHDNIPYILWSERLIIPDFIRFPFFSLSSFSDSKVNFALFLLLMQFNCNGDTSFSGLYAMLFFSYANTLYAWMCMQEKKERHKQMDDKSRVLFALLTDIPDSLTMTLFILLMLLLFRLFFIQHLKFCWINDDDHVQCASYANVCISVGISWSEYRYG